MVELKRVGIVSLGKIFALGGAIGGLLSGLSSGALISAFPTFLPSGMGFDGTTAIIVFAVAGLIGGAIFGFIYGALTALVYNLIAKLVGGVDVTFTKKEAPGVMPAKTSTATTGAAAASAAAGAQSKTSGVATAVNAELLNYVKGELSAGRAKEEVVADLVKAGWSQDDIHAALNAAVLG